MGLGCLRDRGGPGFAKDAGRSSCQLRRRDGCPAHPGPGSSGQSTSALAARRTTWAFVRSGPWRSDRTRLSAAVREGLVLLLVSSVLSLGLCAAALALQERDKVKG